MAQITTHKTKPSQYEHSIKSYQELAGE